MGVKILNIFRNPPDDRVRSIMPAVEPTDQVTEVVLDSDSADYERLLDLIFESDKVFTWF